MVVKNRILIAKGRLSEGSSDGDFAAHLYIFIFVCFEYFQPKIGRKRKKEKGIKPGPEEHSYIYKKDCTSEI